VDNQHGFCSKRSSKTQLLSVVNGIEFWRANRCFVLDSSKAFDKVPHERLYFKLLHYGINGNLLNWIKKFLHERSQTVVIDGVNSKPTSALSGVPQGTVLAPLLFLIFINDIVQNLHCTVRLYSFY